MGLCRALTPGLLLFVTRSHVVSAVSFDFVSIHFVFMIYWPLTHAASCEACQYSNVVCKGHELIQYSTFLPIAFPP